MITLLCAQKMAKPCLQMWKIGNGCIQTFQMNLSATMKRDSVLLFLQISPNHGKLFKFSMSCRPYKSQFSLWSQVISAIINRTPFCMMCLLEAQKLLKSNHSLLEMLLEEREIGQTAIKCLHKTLDSSVIVQNRCLLLSKHKKLWKFRH